MTTAKELLAMIEAVKPDDAEALNKIDARMECFIDKQDPDATKRS